MKKYSVEIIYWSSFIGASVCLSSELIAQYLGLDVWSIIYTGCALILTSIILLLFLVIKKFKK